MYIIVKWKKNKCILEIDITTKVNKAISTLKNKFVPYLKKNLNRPKQVADTTQVVKENYKSDESFKKTGLAYTQEEDDLNYDWGTACGHGYKGTFSDFSKDWCRDNQFK